MPPCRECGGSTVAGTCSACGYVAGTALAETRKTLQLSAALQVTRERWYQVIAEGRDEGHAAGRAEARSAVIHGLAELARMGRVPCRHGDRECECRDVLDREQVMVVVQEIKHALDGGK